MSYLDAATYNTLTGRPTSEATDSRLKRASRLLDSRIGNYNRINDSDNDYDGFKLDLADLRAWQKEAVQEWVAWMTAALYENNDSPDTFAQIKLGRFSVSENSDDENNNLPGMVKYADMQLRDAKLINTHVRSVRHVTDDDRELTNVY